MIEEIHSIDGFFLKILDEYHWFKVSYKSHTDKKCFIYGYMRDLLHKRASAISKNKETLSQYTKNINRKTNKYIFLEALDIAREKGLIEEDEFVSRFKKLTGSEDFAAYDKELVEEAKHKFLIGYIDDFFINKRYSVKECKKFKDSEEKSTVYISELDMWKEYCKYASDSDKIAAQTTLDRKFEDECAAWFNRVNQDENIDCGWFPLYIDNRNGAGIYIINQEELESALMSEDYDKIVEDLGYKDYYICVTQFYFFGFADGFFIPKENKGKRETKEEPKEFFFQNVVWSRFFTNVHDAFSFFRDNSFRFFELYEEYNNFSGKAPIESYIDSKFVPFFLKQNADSAIPHTPISYVTEEIIRDMREMSVRNTRDKQSKGR